ncbi:DNA topoisomerase [Metabacillus sp. HB246100]
MLPHYESAVYEKSEVITLVDEHLQFKTKGSRPIKVGWKYLYLDDTQKDLNEEDTNLPLLNKGDIVTLVTNDIKEGVTKPPNRFTAGQLVKVMSNAGALLKSKEKGGYSNKELTLGTVATQSNIIKQIIEKGNIIIKDNNLNRSEESVLQKVKRLKLAFTRDNLGLLTVGELARLIPVDRNTVCLWIEKIWFKRYEKNN